jgi:chromosome partitioning protein
MNTKGGVGKSTLVMALAETLATHFGKRVLLIDSDAQMSLSLMVMPVADLQARRDSQMTLVELLRRLAMERVPADWKDFVVSDATDIDDTNAIWLLPSDMHLTLFEREVSAFHRHVELRQAVREVLDDATSYFDFILVDCPPGLSVLTETWLREADYHLTPVKPDFLAVSGLETLRAFKKLNPELGFAENIGVLVNLKDERSEMDDMVHQALMRQSDLHCFADALPRLSHLQHAALYMSEKRSYLAKYPGISGNTLRKITMDLLARLDRRAAEAQQRARVHEQAPPPRPSEQPATASRPTEPAPPPAPKPAPAVPRPPERPTPRIVRPDEKAG